MPLKIKITHTQMDQQEVRLKQRLRQPRALLRRIHTYMIGRTAMMFRRLAHGGTFRGVTWDFYKPQYRRSDGVEVPAWGGVGKLRGSGTVRGRRRPSGRRITPASNLLRDTGRLAAAAGASARYRRGGMSLEMVTGNVAYAAYQAKSRPFLFFEVPRDTRVFEEMAVEHMES